ncbi:4-hydroxy-tetrahydrodipicolinate reductase [Rathayibacter toxicus]|uniref:4-hydroxy-tetrahydrodipicolinate reductase n=1 Tax=Rathayibacter toxicus TaxID=145458 RepID=A0A0C5BRU7_9MICO|nr:4-hydroxy-tetrahydrodipicolinate reductase [Rathayibacter toxicus]AJM77397.1 dihydrodipicolinate reductase [Rathayibacter toxicus]ALS56707.1 4-hydroxy-tetrahydrodipicolinate reductase [Rathayibacter toxicus]KKM45830.1 dihydrodipicolinate reductase [Rathayibacter toxicus]PPG22301.1 4-hydroxy-tetrahydrodipicolinate reductase [Rathayibacter toxicus]PPG47136.1 4-hydroxy-tetrahydrodipicolinate reductase [Rathayibacter toxicus]
MTTSVAVVGASGALGSSTCSLLDAADEFAVIARLGSRSDLREMLAAEIVIDMTLPAVSQRVVEYAVENGKKVLVGTSGWTGERIGALRRIVAARPEAGVVIIPNFSLGSVVATALETVAARFFDAVEIIETHGARKLDSPSGTAVRTAELLLRSRAERGPVHAPHTDQRARGQQVASVPVHSLRLPGVLARQEVIFGGIGESVTIRHDTSSSASYERGILLALEAARTATGVIVGLDSLLDLRAEFDAALRMERAADDSSSRDLPSGQIAATTPSP